MSLPTKEKTWKTGVATPEGSMLPNEFFQKMKDALVEKGWTVRYSGVIYDHDPGDEHVEPERWVKAEPTKFVGGEPVSWTLKNPDGDLTIEYAEPRPDAKL